MDDRVEDFHVARTATEVSGETCADVGLVGLGRVFEKADGGEHHTRRADAALRAAALNHRALDGMQALTVGDTFDRTDVRALDLCGGDEATVDQPAVDEHRARAALALAAALLRPRQG